MGKPVGFLAADIMSLDKNTLNFGFAIGLERAGWEFQEVVSIGKERIYIKKAKSLDGAGFRRKYELSLSETQQSCVTFDHIGVFLLDLIDATDIPGRHPIMIDRQLAAEFVEQIDGFEDELLANGVPFTPDYFLYSDREGTAKDLQNKELRQTLNLDEVERQLKEEWWGKQKWAKSRG